MNAFIVLGDTLTIPEEKYDLYIFIESTDLTTHFQYHKHKIIFFLSSMRGYADSLRSKEHNVSYTPISKEITYKKALQDVISEYNIDSVGIYEPKDHFFNTVHTVCKNRGIEIEEYDNPNFLTSRPLFKEYLQENKLYHNSFYIWQRKRLDILVEDGSPYKGKWSFDSENREKLKDPSIVPEIPSVSHNDYVKEVKDIVAERFSTHPGDVHSFWLPTTHKQAKNWYQIFLDERFNNFGPYQDAINKDVDFGFHSVISPMLNNGLLSPHYVVKRAITYYEENMLPYSSLEGFIRQIIGWREFMRGVYDNKSLQKNFFQHTNKLSDKWYTGETGLDPVDDAIKQVLHTGYGHHIQRLMIFSNAMLLCQIDPDEVYTWFMELFVDSADWVMQPNVYDMGQFATGGLFATKPYISSSNYIRKMSDYGKGKWSEEWDALYWTFLENTYQKLKENNRMGFMLSLLDKKSDEQMEQYRTIAEKTRSRLSK